MILFQEKSTSPTRYIFSFIKPIPKWIMKRVKYSLILMFLYVQNFQILALFDSVRSPY